MRMKALYHYLLITVVLLFINTITIGCQNANENAAQNQSAAVRNVNAKNEKTDQTAANKAKNDY